MTTAHQTPEYLRLTRKARPIIQAQVRAGTATCVDCGHPVHPDQRWDIGHRIPLSKGGTNTLANVGPSHRKCNRAAGGRLGATITNRATRKSRRLPNGW